MIELHEVLTRKRWHFVDNTLPANPFMFVGDRWHPGEYILVNASGSNVVVVLFNQRFTVPAHTRWHFMAHADLESFHWLYGPPVGVQRGKPDPVEQQVGPQLTELGFGEESGAMGTESSSSSDTPAEDGGLPPEPPAEEPPPATEPEPAVEPPAEPTGDPPAETPSPNP